MIYAKFIFGIYFQQHEKHCLLIPESSERFSVELVLNLASTTLANKPNCAFAQLCGSAVNSQQPQKIKPPISPIKKKFSLSRHHMFYFWFGNYFHA